MPLYSYSCNSCNESFELLRKMSEMMKALSEPCPLCGATETITQEITSANFGDPVRMGVTRVDGGFSEVLGKIKKAHPRGNWGQNKVATTRVI